MTQLCTKARGVKPAVRLFVALQVALLIVALASCDDTREPEHDGAETTARVVSSGEIYPGLPHGTGRVTSYDHRTGELVVQYKGNTFTVWCDGQRTDHGYVPGCDDVPVGRPITLNEFFRSGFIYRTTGADMYLLTRIERAGEKR
jgi:hypothetical protein